MDRRNVYEQLYEITKTNQKSADGNFEIDKNAFLTRTVQTGRTVDVLAFWALPEEEFLAGAYINLFNRSPDPQAEAIYAKAKQEKTDSYKVDLVTELLRSDEWQGKKCCMRNAFMAEVPKSCAFWVQNTKKAIKNFLKKCYHLLPFKMQCAVRGLIKGEK